MEIKLTGKVVLVTGASRGIGEAIARQLAESGAQVAVHYNRNANAANEIVEHIGNGAKAIHANLARTIEVNQLYDSVIRSFGRIDVLVNNAGIALNSPMDTPMEEWLDQWDRTQTVNLKATAQLSRLCIEHWQERKAPGRLIHIASRAAFRGDTPDYLAYAASKAGMVALSRSIARGYGKDGITSFVIAPGFVRTDMAQPFLDAYGEDYATFDIALNRLTEPRDLAPMVCLLASGLSDHATGTVIDINAGSYVR